MKGHRLTIYTQWLGKCDEETKEDVILYAYIYVLILYTYSYLYFTHILNTYTYYMHYIYIFEIQQKTHTQTNKQTKNPTKLTEIKREIETDYHRMI